MVVGFGLVQLFDGFVGVFGGCVAAAGVAVVAADASDSDNSPSDSAPNLVQVGYGFAGHIQDRWSADDAAAVVDLYYNSAAGHTFADLDNYCGSFFLFFATLF